VRQIERWISGPSDGGCRGEPGIGPALMAVAPGEPSRINEMMIIIIIGSLRNDAFLSTIAMRH